METPALEEYPCHILACTEDHVVVKHNSYIILNDINMNKISHVAAPVDCRYYDFCDSGKHLIFLFSGKDFVVIPKNGEKIISYTLNPISVGRACNKIICCGESVFIGTSFGDRSQVIKYDFIHNSKVIQMASKNIKQINNIVKHKNDIVALFGQSVIIAYGEEGDIKWQRFLPSLIGRNIISQGDNVWFSSGPVITGFDGKNSKVIKLPVSCSELYAIDRNIVLFLSAERKTLVSFDVIKNSVVWERSFENSVKDIIVDQNMIVLKQDGVEFLSFSNGKTVYNKYIDQIYQMKTMNGKLLLHSQGKSTHVVTMV